MKKSKNPTLLSCSATYWLHFKTSPTFLAFKMVGKSGTHGNVKIKNPILRKTQNFLEKILFSPMEGSEKPVQYP